MRERERSVSKICSCATPGVDSGPGAPRRAAWTSAWPRGLLGHASRPCHASRGLGRLGHASLGRLGLGRRDGHVGMSAIAVECARGAGGWPAARSARPRKGVAALQRELPGQLEAALEADTMDAGTQARLLQRVRPPRSSQPCSRSKHVVFDVRARCMWCSMFGARSCWRRWTCLRSAPRGARRARGSRQRT